MMNKNGMNNPPVGPQQQQLPMSGINRPPPPPSLMQQPPQSSQMLPGNVQSPVSHPMPRQIMPVQQQSMQGSTGMVQSPMMPQMMMSQQQQQQQPPPIMSQVPPMQQQQLPQQTMQPQHPQPFPKQILCRLGVDTVQDIVSKTLELFQNLRSMGAQLANTNQQLDDKKNKIKDTIKIIETLFIKLRKIYNTCNEPSSMDYVDLKSLLPLKDDDDGVDSDEENNEKSHTNGQVNHSSMTMRPLSNEEKKNNPKLQQLEKEYFDLVELNRLKNRQIKEIIDRIRKMVWDINTMLAMRRP